MASLRSLGFSPFFQAQLRPGEQPARVVAVHRGEVELLDPAGRRRAPLEGLAVGDWVASGRPLSRRSWLVRKAAGRTSSAQLLAANVDVVWIVTAVGPDLSVARIERYLAMAFEGGVSPVVVVNKSDRGAPEVDLSDVEVLAPVLSISARDGDGIDALVGRITRGQSVAMLGSSGVGKSTLLNRLVQDAVAGTAEVRAGDDKGRHTTTRQELHVLDDWVLIDMPGLREVGLVPGEAGVAQVFEEVEALAGGCRFRDCRHEVEPGCAVVAGMNPDRLERYRRLVREQAAMKMRQDARAEKQAGRRMGRMIREAKAWRRKRR